MRCSLDGFRNSHYISKHSNAGVIELDALHNLGNLYRDHGRLSEAEKMYPRALKGRKKTIGAEHTSTLGSIHCPRNTLRGLGKLCDAEKMYQRALEGREKALGAEHTSTLNTFSRLANKQAGKQRYFSALLACLLACLLASLTVSNLGLLYNIQSKLDEADKMYQRALKGHQHPPGLNGATTYIPALNTTCNLAMLFTSQGDVARTREMSCGL
ncbi:hypothetical protein K469DRAFT_769869 [Zopfia rhizophila CBS 207.26]|uniref:TPR-like protein n=1 Tax=Zopfia rhizophila CBS 207.26 TaxID=1314779 RepID=A0A6A6E7L5_9PEZI|nr:hypothetical protein K469DRAFT_769869 [Zopfia rhizophila CBS 207.26]